MDTGVDNLRGLGSFLWHEALIPSPMPTAGNNRDGVWRLRHDLDDIIDPQDSKTGALVDSITKFVRQICIDSIRRSQVDVLADYTVLGALLGTDISRTTASPLWMPIPIPHLRIALAMVGIYPLHRQLRFDCTGLAAGHHLLNFRGPPEGNQSVAI